MLKLADRPIEKIIPLFSKYSVDAAYFVPTETALKKSIVDAHVSFRAYLKLKGIHDYKKQKLGQEHKKTINAYFVTSTGLESTKGGFYRPETKNGDPRFWFSNLKKYCDSGNVIAMVFHKDNLYLINCSDRQLVNQKFGVSEHLLGLFLEIQNSISPVAQELLDKLREIAEKGWITSKRAGPTGVGYTLETLLGIPANSKKTPDYKGIELKSARTIEGRVSSRSTLFSKSPNWKKSAIKKALDLLDDYGYHADGRLQLYCSLSNSPNSRGHFLTVPDDGESVLSMYQSKDDTESSEVLLWEVSALLKSLETKHKETFWIDAEVRLDPKGREQFLYTAVTHTQRPFVGSFVPMIKLGQIELDYLLHVGTNKKGGRRARDHGYLFKIWQKNFHLLFPAPKTHLLLAHEG